MLKMDARLTAGFLFLFAVLQGTAALFGSTRGEWGLAVAIFVVFAAFFVQRALHGVSLGEAGLRAEWRGLGVGAVVSGAILAMGAAYLDFSRAAVSLHPNAPWLALGILFQAGVAEELVFRGYLYGHLARRRPFWRAAMVSMGPFALVHAMLFLTLDWPVAAASLVLSVALAFPLAHLFELGFRTVWVPALVHAVIQAGPKLIVVDDALFPLIWMLVSLAIAWCSFLCPRPTATARRPSSGLQA
jgi:membrane protease YdiL (CAAX protease family)